MILTGNALHLLPTLESESVRAVVTSPPYWELRDYDDRGQDWPEVRIPVVLGGFETTTVVPAGRSPLGQEHSPFEYAARLVTIFREVRRVLTSDGSLWLNLGDTYATNSRSGGGTGPSSTLSGGGRTQNEAARRSGRYRTGLAQKNLCGIPWLVATLLRSDDWYLRADVIWHKKNPQPESCKDRPSKGHEYLFLLTKSPNYLYNNDEMRIRGTGSHKRGPNQSPIPDRPDLPMLDRRVDHPRGARLRTVWSLASQPYQGSHFAVMPPSLIAPCVAASSRSGDTILDPFAGSGAVGEIARLLGRRFVGIELNPEYAPLIKRRVQAGSDLRTGIADILSDDLVSGRRIDRVHPRLRKLLVEFGAYEKSGWVSEDGGRSRGYRRVRRLDLNEVARALVDPFVGGHRLEDVV